jgi:two-component system sensor histidine kinase BaeS
VLRVWVRLEQSARHASLAVCDNGPGISAEDLPNIFNHFWRKDKSRSRKAGGSGLGLAIARQFVEIQGGTITAENLSGGGLMIKILLPKPA